MMKNNSEERYQAVASLSAEFLETIEMLRSENGCPWDREQTHESLRQCLQEECAEVIEAIEKKDNALLCEELGDILLNVVMHSVIAAESGKFDYSDVISCVRDKMIRRHPHVFADTKVGGSSEVLAVWDEIKKKEKSSSAAGSVLDGVPNTLSALLRAHKVQLKAAKYGFDWEHEKHILAKIEEELHELEEAMESGDDSAVSEEIGDLLFAVVNLSRFRAKDNAEDMLSSAIGKFRSRFKYIEKSLAAQNIELENAGIERMEALWQEAKTKDIQ